MKINTKRLWDHIMELGRIGSGADGSVTRFPFTPEDKSAEKLICRYMEEAGLDVERDGAGNLIGKWTPAGSGAAGQPPVMTGSHYDTVLQGGKFDGCLGVLGAIEAVQTLREEGYEPKVPVWVIGFKDEEGNRFGYGMIGSKAICGRALPEGLISADADGISLGDAMRAYGLSPDSLDTCRVDRIKAMLELHIEQGQVLEKNGSQIGIVEGIAGLERYTVTITGSSAHAGATPMSERSDPVPAMSRWILKATELAKERKDCVATVGRIKVLPGTCNIICGETEFSLDIRSVRDEDIRDIMEEMSRYEKLLEEQERVSIKRALDQSLPGVPCDSGLKERMEQICDQYGYANRRLMSGAGHDSMNFGGLCPVSMIFVPSQGGYSHRKEEFTSMEDCEAGTQVLMEMIREITSR